MAQAKSKSKSKKRPLRKTLAAGNIWAGQVWVARRGTLRRGKGHPGKTPNLFSYVGEKLPFETLDAVRKDVTARTSDVEGIYIAHDSMGCSRYIGRGNVFGRLAARKHEQPDEVVYFSFYLVKDKKHEREIETLLIRAAGFLLEFNDRKKRVGISPGNITDYEAGTHFYERQRKKGKKKR